jgi:hypothetical protein
MNNFKAIPDNEFLSLTPISKLDFILRYLNSTNSHPELPSEICKSIWKEDIKKENLSLLPKEVKMVCEKLYKDGYVLLNAKKVDNEEKGVFSISFEGRFLIVNQNGYQHLENERLLSEKKKRFDLRFQRVNVFAVTVATLIISIEPLHKIFRHFHWFGF